MNQLVTVDSRNRVVTVRLNPQTSKPPEQNATSEICARWFRHLKVREFPESTLCEAETTFEGLSRETRDRLNWNFFNPDFDTHWSAQLPLELRLEIHYRGLAGSISRSRIFAVPDATTNYLACREIGKEFTDRQIKATSCFNKIRDLGGDGIHREFWLCAAYRFPRGYLKPAIAAGRIRGIQIFRSVSDPEPFLLNTGGPVNV